MRADVDVLVVGGGQAGLAVSHGLAASGVDHVVLEQDRVGSAWSRRWDSFRLVTPNHTIRLPGGEYRGAEPDGFLARDEVAGHLRGYAASFAAPVVERTRVDALRADGGGFIAETSAGRIRARRVVVCTGAYQRAHRPAFVAEFERALPVVPATEYRSPASLPAGRVLVIGGGQSGLPDRRGAGPRGSGGRARRQPGAGHAATGRRTRHRRLAGGRGLLRAHARGHALTRRPVRLEPARHGRERWARPRPAHARRPGRAAHRPRARHGRWRRRRRR